MSPASGKRWRAALVRRSPAALMEYPFETFLAFLGGVMGAALALGAFRPGSLFAALPFPVVMAYAVAAVAGSVTVVVGLVPRRKNPVPMAVGLRLIGVLLAVYGVAVGYYAGVKTGGMTGLLFIGVAALAGFRSAHLRAQAEAALAIHRGE